MNKGKFLKKEKLTPELLDYLKSLNSIAEGRNETLAEMALAWILHQKGITSVLVGASNVEQLDKNMKCVHAEPFRNQDI
jgi:L-glyceraldehyde 3-phosphate reductase